jgi:hypothetical protein
MRAANRGHVATALLSGQDINHLFSHSPSSLLPQFTKNGTIQVRTIFQEDCMTSNNDVTLSSRVTELEGKLTTTLDRLAKAEATIDQLNKSIAAGNRMTNWQFIGFVVVMAGTLFGTMYWSTGVLERRMDQLERNLSQRFEDTNRRFDDLRQIVVSQQQKR